jgi:hypothetical protein
MDAPPDKPDLTRAQLADISKLADGTLDPARRDEVRAAIAASPELSELYARERHVVELLHEARAADRAPASLRARIAAQRPKPATIRRRRISYGGGLAAAIAAVLLAVILVLPGGTPGGPSVSQAAALALLGPTAAAPASDPNAPAARLNQEIEDVYFPNWSARFGWEAVGRRTDQLGHRMAVTVYYASRGKQVAYTIVAAPSLPVPGAQKTTVHGVLFWTFSSGGRVIITWQRSGHTCVLSAKGVDPSELQRLAAWQEAGGPS